MGTEATPFRVHLKVNLSTSARPVACLILVLASVAFIAGGLMSGGTTGGVLFIILGASGVLLFGVGLATSAGRLFGRRPVLELDAEGVRRPAGWPLPRARDRFLPWDRVSAMTAVRRGVSGTKRGEQDYLIFLPTPELAELARTAERPSLIALTLPDVPATAEALPWCFAIEPGWDATLPQIVKQARRHHETPVIDRRNE
ncbi:hypothetical protein [Spirillospora sp. CA-294931]|uniref:hypothetical protein n=1 Tax=Spirillospora sp. CA-294931 TaxID=3240042 RepID=UPI003D9509ED